MNPYDAADFRNDDDWPEDMPEWQRDWPNPCPDDLHDVIQVRIDWCRTCGETWDRRG